MPMIQKPAWQQWRQQSAEYNDEATIRPPKKKASLKRNQTFAAADTRYQALINERRRRGSKYRYTVPLFPPPSSYSGILSGQNAEAPPDLYVRTSLELFQEAFGGGKENASLSRDQISQLTAILALPDQYSPGARSASSGFGSCGLGSSDVSFRSNARSLTAVSPDSAVSLFSSTPSKIGSISAKRRIHFDIDIEEPKSIIPTSVSLPSLSTKEIEYRAPRLMPAVAETKYVTTVFEVLRRGLLEMADSVRDEIRRFYDQGLIIVCCEMRWSTPDSCRDIVSEIRMKDDVLSGLRVNNKRILDKVMKEGQYVLFPDSVTEEVVARKRGYFGGAYRRYYGGLLPAAHAETAKEHEPWWKLKKSSELDDVIDWPLIASRTKTTVVVLNLICLKMERS